jgi:anti-sigma factor RsiW
MDDPIRSDGTPHDEADALLPWYATAQLDSADRGLVETHLASCARCQHQLMLERRMIDEFQAFAPEVAAGWIRLRDRIDRAAYRPSRTALAARQLWAILRQPPVAALAATQVAFLVLAVTILPGLSRPAYHALGSADAPHNANVIVVFQPDAREADIRNALRTSGASLVGGPTSADAYLLYVPKTARSSALGKLQADHDIAMAQPIDGPAQ